MWAASEGFEVEEAADGEIGWQKVHQGGHDLIVLDLVLPKMDGLEVLRQLTKNPSQKPNGPIVILTNLGQDSVIREGLSLGAAGYLIKSAFNPDQVLLELKNFLGKN